LCLINKGFIKVLTKSMFIMACICLFDTGAYAFEVSEIEISPGLTVYESYDDNKSYASSHELGDFITKVSPGVSAAYDAKDFRWDLYADITQVMFSRNSEFDNTSENLKFNGEIELSKHDRVSLAENFAHTYEPVSFEQAFGRTLGRYSYYTNNIVVEYIRDINSQCSASVSYGHQTDQFSNRTAEDSFMNTVGVRFDYAVTSWATAFVLDEFSKREYERGSDVSRNRTAVGIKHNITKQLSYTAQAGIDCIDAGRDYSKPLISISVADKINEATEAAISYIKEYALSQYEQDCFNSWQTSAKLFKQASARFRYTLGLFYGEGKYASAAFNERFIGSEVSCDYSLNKNMDIVASYVFSKVISGDADQEYVKNRVMTGLKAKF